MGFIRDIDNTRQKLADVYVGEKAHIEKLRLIMCEKLGREVSYQEAQQAAVDLVDFYKTLAQGKKIVIGGVRNKGRFKEA